MSHCASLFIYLEDQMRRSSKHGDRRSHQHALLPHTLFYMRLPRTRCRDCSFALCPPSASAIQRFRTFLNTNEPLSNLDRFV